MATSKTKSAAPKMPRSTLRATDTPGIFRNRAGVLVDADGVALSFKEVRKADDDDFTQVLGRPARTPLDVIEGVALDPRAPKHVRLDAATKAAPYRHAKLVAVGGSSLMPPIGVTDMSGWSQEKLDAYEKALRAAADIATK